ncbi:FAD-dependent oxidoreductase, partial [Geobacillus stearothermophilus]
MAKEYDVVILGGGTGGYVAAIRASQLGLKTAVVEKGKLGGTCLHAGCIPSKALLRSAEVYAQTKNSEAFGVIVGDVRLDFAKVQARKATIVDQLHKGVQHLMKKGKIDVYAGIGRLLGPSIFSPLPGTVSVEMNDGSENEM